MSRIYLSDRIPTILTQPSELGELGELGELVGFQPAPHTHARLTHSTVPVSLKPSFGFFLVPSLFLLPLLRFSPGGRSILRPGGASFLPWLCCFFFPFFFLLLRFISPIRGCAAVDPSPLPFGFVLPVCTCVRKPMYDPRPGLAAMCGVLCGRTRRRRALRLRRGSAVGG